MIKQFLVACMAATALIPVSAFAQQSCERQRSTRTVATVGGAVVGGVAGNVIAGRGDKKLGTAIGAVLGAVVGNQVAKPDSDCSRAFGYYDDNNRWHATGIDPASATGYYDRNGDWVNGTPSLTAS